MMGPGGRKDVKPRPVPRRLSLARKIGAKRVARGGDFRPRPPDRAGPHQRGGRLPQSAGAHLLPQRADPARRIEIDVDGRSEEHTSELQSLMRISYAVLCLKNKTSKTITAQQLQTANQ